MLAIFGPGHFSGSGALSFVFLNECASPSLLVVILSAGCRSEGSFDFVRRLTSLRMTDS
jgi:hypothetical protein